MICLSARTYLLLLKYLKGWTGDCLQSGAEEPLIKFSSAGRLLWVAQWQIKKNFSGTGKENRSLRVKPRYPAKAKTVYASESWERRTCSFWAPLYWPEHPSDASLKLETWKLRFFFLNFKTWTIFKKRMVLQVCPRSVTSALPWSLLDTQIPKPYAAKDLDLKTPVGFHVQK